MSRRKKLLSKARRGASLSFCELVLLAQWFGFVLARVRGSHHIFRHEGVEEFLNLQDVKGNAKDYQVQQLLALIESYGLDLEEANEDALASNAGESSAAVEESEDEDGSD
jgi:hypothetical protein